MNSFFNMSMIGLPNTYQAPPNFIETLFRYVMDNGYDKLGLVCFLQLYLYMSLSHIEKGFKYLNDKIALYGRQKLEQYFIAVMVVVSSIFNFFYDIFMSCVFQMPTRATKWIGSTRLFSLPKQIYKWFFKTATPVMATNNPVTQNQKPVINKHMMKLDPVNAVDMNALGHYILTNKRTLALDPVIDRTYSSKKSTVEAIAVPENLVLALQGDIVVQLSHHISLKYEFETDHVNEKIKKYVCDKMNPDDKTKKTGGKASALKEALNKLWGEKNIYSDDPQFWYKKCEWSCDPESMTNTNYTVLWRVLYYQGDVNVIRKFIQYLLGEEPFKFDDKVYEKTDDAIEGDFKDVFKDKANLEGYLAEVPDYHLQFVNNLDEQGVKATIDELSKKFFARYQGAKGEVNSRISINFASPSLDKYQLAKYGRMWFAKLIHQFYDQTTKKTGEKVTIYKLGIAYDTKVTDEPNPKYIEWEKEQAEELRRKQEEQAKQIQAIQLQQQLEKDKLQLAAQAIQLQQQQQIQQQQLIIQQQLQQVSQVSGGQVPTSGLSTPSIESSNLDVLDLASSTNLLKSQDLGDDKDKDRDGRGKDAKDKDGKDKDRRRGSRSRSRSRTRGSRSSRRKQEGRRNNNRRYSSSSSSSDDDWDPSTLDLFEGDFEGFGSYTPYNNNKGKKSKGKKWKNRGNVAGAYWNEFGGNAGNITTYKQPPTKTIKVEHKIPSAHAKPIKQDRKPLEYLYLPEQSMEALVEYLRNFKDHRDRFQKYGFPYRGGLILSGAPGCGKSSTILATATYLQKDIYYLDLGQIKTNHELKLCVDYIRTNSSNGGVIIFEDIDCMNDIVHRRPEHVTEMTTETNLTKLTEEGDGPLSLAYLLNVLDGTMAPEDVIFIMTTNHIEKLDKALIRPGRIDLDIELTKCTRVQLQKIYLDLYGKELPKDILDRFPEKHWITARVILHLFHNSFDSNIDPEVLIAPLLNTSEDELGEMYTQY